MRRSLIAWLNSLTALELGLVFSGFFFLITMLGIAIIHPHIRRAVHSKKQVNDVVIFVAANYGVVYAVLLGLMVVATFQITKDLQDHISQEASSLGTMYRSTDAYPEPLRSELRAQLLDYTHYVLDKDWPAHREGRVLPGGDHRLQAIRQTLFSFEPKTASQQEIHREVLRYFNTMTSAREERVGAVFPSIPDVLWYALWIGALVTIVFLWMLHLDLIPQIVFAGITAIFLGLMIFLIYAMDHPLQGAVSVEPDAIQAVYDTEMKWEDTNPRATTVSFGTGELNGLYYPVGQAICDIINRDPRKDGVRCSAEETAGSIYNIDAIRNGDLEFGIVQSDIARAAYTGVGDYADHPFIGLRSVLVLHPELITIIVKKDSGIHGITDLAGRRVNVGRLGSGPFATWNTIEAALGWNDSQKAQITDLGPIDASKALCDGNIDASLLVAGHPSETVRMQLSACATELVPVSGPEIDALVLSAPYLRKGSVPGALYGLEADTPTIGTNAVVMTSEGEDPRIVASFAQVIVANIDKLRARNAALANLTVEDMTGGNVPAPFHPAASKVFEGLAVR